MNGRRGGDQGFSLLELIIAITIMGMAVGAVFGGLGLFFKVENIQGSNARIDTEIRNYAERVIVLPYTNCATATTYKAAAVPPTGYTTDVTVKYWDGAMPAGFGATCSTDLGLQQVTIVLTDVKGVKGTLVIGKSR